MNDKKVIIIAVIVLAIGIVGLNMFFMTIESDGKSILDESLLEPLPEPPVKPDPPVITIPEELPNMTDIGSNINKTQTNKSNDIKEQLKDITKKVKDKPKIDKSRFKQAPDIIGIADYINITPEQLDEKIKGNVVLYDIWTYSCINCIRTLPYITAWDEKYKDQGLLIIGIHTPEFEFEKDVDNVRTAVNKYNINYPVVLDNDKETWNAFENRYWPRKYIADHEGYIRYNHIGEGAYKETELVIQRLLQERADAIDIQPMTDTDLVDIEEFEHTRIRTPELYFGYNFAYGRNQLGSQEGFQPDKTVVYSAPDDIRLNYFYPVGTWHNTPDGMRLISDDGRILLHYIAKEVNIVTEGTAVLEIYIDGQLVQDDIAGIDVVNGTVQTNEPDLYNIISNDTSEKHVLEIKVKGDDFQIFTFTFG